MTLKKSIQQYRTINSKRFIMWTADPSEFEEAKKQCKKGGVAYRIIKEQFYKETV